MPAGYPPKRAMRLVDRAMSRSPFRVARATFEPGDADDGVSWGDLLRGVAREFRRTAKALERAADICDGDDTP